MSQTRRTGPNVHESCLPFGSLDATAMDVVTRDAVESAKRRARICCHQSLEDSPQEMIICLQPRTYIRPHRHFGRAESGLGLHGLADAVFFDLNGNITDAWPMSTYESGKRFFYRIQEPVFHCLLLRDLPFVFHEVSTGPFSRESTEFAPWSPPEDAANAVSSYLDELSERVTAFYRRGTDD
jgi:cupin fold WbuC family metalloprotein